MPKKPHHEHLKKSPWYKLPYGNKVAAQVAGSKVATQRFIQSHYDKGETADKKYRTIL